MKTSVAIFVVLACSAATAQVKFKVDTREVAVVFRAVGRDGRPVPGLSESQFVVRDEGTDAPLTSFTGDAAPATVVVLSDVSGSMLPVFESLQGALYTFADIALEDVAQETGAVALSLIPFSETAKPLIDRTSNPARFKEAVRWLRPAGSTALVDAMVGAMQNAFGPPGAEDGFRRARFLVVLTDAGENASSHAWAEVVSAALTNEVVVYAIYFTSGSRDSAPDTLRNVAVQTGGQIYSSNARELAAVYAAVARDIRSQYLLTFRPPSDIQYPRRWRRISISVKDRKDIRIFARAGYCPESPCQNEEGVFIGPRPTTPDGLVALSRDEIPGIIERLQGLKLDYDAETAAILRTHRDRPLIVEKRWAREQAGKDVRYAVTDDPHVSIDAEVCGIQIEDGTALAALPAGGSRALLVVRNPAVRTVVRPDGGEKDPYFQSQLMFDLADGTGSGSPLLSVRCSRPNYLVSQELINLALSALDNSLKIKVVRDGRAR